MSPRNTASRKTTRAGRAGAALGAGAAALLAGAPALRGASCDGRSAGSAAPGFCVAAASRGAPRAAPSAPTAQRWPRPAALSRRGRTELRALPLQEEAASLLVAGQQLLEQIPLQVEAFGPAGPVVFFAVFVLAECLSLPASPLMLSSGYLFGLAGGAGLALLSLCTAATISFFLARTVLRPQLLKIAKENSTFQDIDTAVQAEGLKIIFLLRLAPVLPFALSNYAYGLTQVSYTEFILATATGCAPGTFAVVYLATTAKAAGDGAGQPWYVYALSIAVTIVLLKFVSDIATEAVQKSVKKESESGLATR